MYFTASSMSPQAFWSSDVAHQVIHAPPRLEPRVRTIYSNHDQHDVYFLSILEWISHFSLVVIVSNGTLTLEIPENWAKQSAIFITYAQRCSPSLGTE